MIPRTIGFADGAKFQHVSNISRRIERGDPHVGLKSHFVLDSSNATLIPCFGNESAIVIPHHVQLLCLECF
jgi:hypothetical protein